MLVSYEQICQLILVNDELFFNLCLSVPSVFFFHPSTLHSVDCFHFSFEVYITGQ